MGVKFWGLVSEPVLFTNGWGHLFDMAFLKITEGGDLQPNTGGATGQGVPTGSTPTSTSLVDQARAAPSSVPSIMLEPESRGRGRAGGPLCRRSQCSKRQTLSAFPFWKPHSSFWVGGAPGVVSLEIGTQGGRHRGRPRGRWQGHGEGACSTPR